MVSGYFDFLRSSSSMQNPHCFFSYSIGRSDFSRKVQQSLHFLRCGFWHSAQIQTLFPDERCLSQTLQKNFSLERGLHPLLFFSCSGAGAGLGSDIDVQYCMKACISFEMAYGHFFNLNS